MKTAADIMTKEPIFVREDTPISDATRILLDKGYNGLPVLNKDDELVGILCQSDLVAQQKRLKLPNVFNFFDAIIPLGSVKNLDEEVRRMSAATAGEAMTSDPMTVAPATPLDEVASLMVESKYYTLPVVDGDRVVGIIGKEDILKTLLP